ncbi:unnamed protein product [Cylindrotheca closterium]|uniref:Uncharacterized protein n=1 Tax=Cylindrotheca closterium TaxID=2856 RepID=A0AAD2PX58_9STRA|nr:unnamed protein product [Cylindrotheca closterium]
MIGTAQNSDGPVNFECSILKGAECCTDQDCAAEDNNICVNRNCIDKGYPRFTLEWYGYDDYDLIVTTPSGIALSVLLGFDPTTGGRVGEVVDQEGLGFHTENTYFPSPGAPIGTYTYAVAEFSTQERVNGWTLTVYDEQGEVSRHKGAGGSETFRYERLNPSSSSPLPPSPVTPPISLPCNAAVDECCIDSDCSDPDNACVNRNCVVNGGLRFTLYWEGDDDYDLIVRTPSGISLSFVIEFDPTTGGRVGEPTDQLGSGYHVENTYFPEWAAGAGVFTFSVRPMSTEGEADRWALEVVNDQETVFFQTGVGASRDFQFSKPSSPPVMQPTNRPNSLPTSRPLPTPAPVQRPTGSVCSILTDECCSDFDCPTARDFCVRAYCIRDGSPRFTLTWDGDDDLDLIVDTPLGTTLSRSLIFDPLSGGIFEADNNQEELGSHFENVYFPLAGSPFGEYSLQVRSFRRNGSDDSWTLQIYSDGNLIDTKSGAGESDTIPFVRAGSDEPERPPYDGSRCTPLTDECCFESDCDGGQVCVNRVCLERGYPRITLTWTGDDDLALVVTIPNGQVLSAGINYDAATGARRQKNANRQDYDLNVDSIYFPYLSGTIKYSVDSLLKRGSSRDPWTLAVYEKDTKVQEFTGFGESKNFFYVPPAAVPDPSPSSAPNPFRPPTPSIVPSPTDVGQCPFECCASYDCLADQVCLQRRCLREGTLRFTLSWTGNDNVDLLVLTPDGTELSNANPSDDSSGGSFEVDIIADEDFGFHAENAVFRGSNIPLGTYSYSVNAVNTRGARDEWEVQVFAYSQLVGWQRGQGQSRTFAYTFDGDGSFAPTNAPFPFPSSLPSASPSQHPTNTFKPTRLTEIPSQVPSGEPPPCDESVYECCANSSCGTGEVCLQRQCLRDGTPRFTLTWTGNDDIDLAVITPGGSVVSAFQNDPDSGGIFEPNGDQFGFDFHVENIRFSGSTFGTYEWYVDSFLETGESDTWTLSITVEGEEVDSIEATGSTSGNYEYIEPDNL